MEKPCIRAGQKRIICAIKCITWQVPDKMPSKTVIISIPESSDLTWVVEPSVPMHLPLQLEVWMFAEDRPPEPNTLLHLFLKARTQIHKERVIYL